jgi:TPR repeat protein
MRDILQKKASAGDALYQCALGSAYENGYRGLQKNPTEAVIWYRKAAAQDNAEAAYQLGPTEAAYQLGMAYATGSGVGKDTAQAVNWFRKAVNNGYPKAMRRIGWCYSIGMGVPTNAFLAAYWTRMAAGQEQADIERDRWIREKMAGEDGATAP